MTDRRTVPKFASFKPKTESVPPVLSERPTARHSGNDEVQNKERDRKRHKIKHKHDENRHRKHRSPPRSRSPERTHRSERDVPKPPVIEDDSPELFVADWKGDINNLVYGSIHRYSIPPFRRVGAGGVMGASADLKIDRDNKDDRVIILAKKGNFKSNLRERYIFSKIQKEKPRLLKIKSATVVEATKPIEADFIALQSERGNKRKHRNGEKQSDSEDEEDGEDYRSIHGKSKAKDQPVDEDLEYATESDFSGSEAGRAVHVDATLSQKSMQLARQVEQSPNDIDAWLALIAHQETLLQSGGEKRRVTNAEIRSTADIKLHMYEKALEQAKSLPDRERLLLGIMEEGSKVWDVKTQSSKWEQVSLDNIQSLLLWKSYINFKQTDFSTFRYEEVKDIFVTRIKLLLKNIDSGKSTHVEMLYQQLLYVLLRLTVYMRTSGYSELGIATWQGLLEFNYFAPGMPDDPNERVILFKDFWESEVPRVGEDGSLGWRKYVESIDSSEPPPALVDEAGDKLNDQDIFRSWAKSERLRSRISQFPARTMDEVTEDDPFRVILFSDIEDLVIALPTSELLRKQMIDAFLLFCGLPSIIHEEVRSRLWSSDPFIVGESLDCDVENIKVANPRSTVDPDGNEPPPAISSIFNTRATNFVPSPESMFGSSWFISLPPWLERSGNDQNPVSYKWVRAALGQLSQVYPQTDFLEYSLAIEWRNGPSTIKKASKALLKRHPSNIRLYNAYGLIEWARGNKQVAAGVFEAALGMGKAISEDHQKDLIMIWKSWIWSALDDGDNTTALRLLLSIAEGSLSQTLASSPATLLRAKQHLILNRDHALSEGKLSYAVLYNECLTLLIYLTSTTSTETHTPAQGDILSALSTNTAFSDSMASRHFSQHPIHELHLQFSARLLYHHARSGPFRPAILRTHLAHSLSLFPQNTTLLSLYTFNEARLRIDNRVRTLLQTTILIPEHDCLTSRLFAIHYEIAHGTIHSVRAAFEHAVTSPACAASVALWRFYILFCAKTPRLQDHAKELWFRALRKCPWAKELYIVGFENLAGQVDFGELKGTWKVMGEKGLRVHVDLEEVFEEREEMEKAKGKGRKGGFR